MSFKNEWHYGESQDEASQLITEVMKGLRGEEESDGLYWTGDDAWFCLADRRHSNEDQVSGSYLRVAVNRHTGYGALIWLVDQADPRKGGVYDSVWISDNPESPDFDPRVVSDPGYPLFHDPSSTLPVAQIRAALEEYCRAYTGERPECISWVEGHLNGQRLDRPSIVDFVENISID
ncbi:Imm1 family immunity protein [Planotetraspora kaengkrachanensis]|uniref:Imm1 family immunity protein n=1 Tax=Planotetraspora kaengkrachanensis TaxID=575193 RepID=UPI0019439AFB|nr:Imm1 family immunity protein [Planotetraspora kaengkrachanensis]